MSRRLAWPALVMACAALSCGSDDALLGAAKPHTEEVMRALLEDPGSVYDEASPRLKRDVGRLAFVEGAEDLAEVMGAFESTRRVVDVDVADGESGRSADVVAVFSFARGDVEGSLSFEESGDDWLVVGVSLPIPDELAEEALGAGAARGEQPAPETAVREAKEILAALAQGESGARAASSARDEMARAVEAGGPYRGVYRITWSRIDPEGERADLVAILDYERDWAHAELELIADERNGDDAWRLETLRIVTHGTPPGPAEIGVGDPKSD